MQDSNIRRSIFSQHVVLSADEVCQKVKQLELRAAEAEQTPQLVMLASKGLYEDIELALKNQTCGDLNVVNSMGNVPLLAAQMNSDFKTAYLTTKVLIAAGANVNAYACQGCDGSNLTHASLATPLLIASEGAWERSASIIQLLILSGGVIYCPLTPKGQERVDRAMLQLFEQHKLLYVALLDSKCHFCELSPDLIRLIIGISTFACHVFVDDKLAESLREGPTIALKLMPRKMCCIS